MKKDKTYRYIEGCMYNYQANQSQALELEERKKNLTSVHGHNYEAHIMNGESNPVLDRTHKVLKIETRLASRSISLYWSSRCIFYIIIFRHTKVG